MHDGRRQKSNKGSECRLDEGGGMQVAIDNSRSASETAGVWAEKRQACTGVTIRAYGRYGNPG
jgi:hypothetical protein